MNENNNGGESPEISTLRKTHATLMGERDRLRANRRTKDLHLLDLDIAEIEDKLARELGAHLNDLYRAGHGAGNAARRMREEVAKLFYISASRKEKAEAFLAFA